MSDTGGLFAHTLEITSPAIPVLMGRPALEPTRLEGTENINAPFEYGVWLKTPDALNVMASGAADFNLDDFIGREISCTLQLDGSGEFVPGLVGASADHLGAGTRQINGLITDAQMWGEEGRHIQYRLTVRPWLHLATLTSDCKIYQDKTVVEIFDELFSDYSFPFEKRLYDDYPKRDYQTQLNESDFAFFERLCQEWGISYHFEHSQGRHRLVLSDAMAAYGPNPSAAYQKVAYHPPGWRTDAEFIHSFVPHHQLTSGKYGTRDYDYTQPKNPLAASRTERRPTGQADQEVYQWHASQSGSAGSHYAQPRAGATGGNDPAAEGNKLALLRMEALRTHGSRARASGNLRGMVPGCTFKLQGHPREVANAEFLILETRFLIEDVAQDSQNKDASLARNDRAQQWRVQVDLTAHPVTEPLRPELTRIKPHTGGPQPALVVGPDGQNIWSDDLGRIKVQFPWDRIGQKNQHSSCWLRVSSPWAGNQLGGNHLPRIGQEVIVDFYGGDPDLPICTGRVHNQMNLPPWKLPSQQALSGLRSRELSSGGGNASAGRSNHLVLDDTAGKIQAQLKSDDGSSSLSLGAITRIEDNAGRKDARGHGFELRTDAHGALRAMEGLLISTEGRPDAQAHITDMAETVARLTHARKLHDNLGAAAQEAKGQDAGDQDDVAKALKAQNDDIRGAGKQPRPEAGEFPELDAPHIVIASSAGIGTTSAQDTHLHAGAHIGLTSDKHTSIAAGQSFLASARKAVRLFAHGTGIRLIAYAGDIDIKALKSSISILAQLTLTQTADEINIAARKKLTLGGGGSTIELDASGIEQATSGLHRVFAAAHSQVGPKNAPTPTLSGSASLKQDSLDVEDTLSFVLRSHPLDGRLVSMEPYTLYKDGAEVERGWTDARGRILIKNHEKGTSAYKVRLSNGNEFELPVVQRLQSSDEHLAAQGYRAARGDPQDRRHHFQQRQGDVEQG